MSSTGGSWRVAGRLARREVRRHPWRHLLVTGLILVPVLAALAAFTGLTTYRAIDQRNDAFTFPDPTSIHLRSEQVASPGGNGQDLRDPEAARAVGLPRGTRTETWWSGTDWFYGDRERADGQGPLLVGAEVVETPPGTTSARQFVVATGRLPRRADEIFLTAPLARSSGWTVGDTVRSARGDRSFEVVGTGLFGAQTERRVAAVAGLSDGYWTQAVHGIDGVEVGEDYPQTTVSSQVLTAWVGDPAIRQDLLGRHFAGSETIRSVDGRVGAALTMASAAMCAVVAVVASAAFAISSRRQLRSIGLLSTVGTDPTTIRRAMLLQGAIPGIVAGVGAVVVAVGAVSLINAADLAQRLSRVAGAQLSIPPTGSAVVVLLGLASGIAAAWQPARTASRVPTLAALAGRRPLGPVPSRVPAGGLILWGCGAAALVLGFGTGRSGAMEQAQPFLVITGVAAIALGGVGLAPMAVALLDPLARRFRGTWRMGLRGLARHRMQSAASVAAIGVVLAIPVGLLTTRNGLDDRLDAGVDPAGCCLPTSTIVPQPAADLLLNQQRGTQIVVGGNLLGDAAAQAIDDVHDVLGSDAVVIRTIPLVDQDGRWREVAVIDEDASTSVLAPWAAAAIAGGRAVAFDSRSDPITLTAEGESATFAVEARDDGRLGRSLPIQAAVLVGAEALQGVGANRPTTAAVVVRPTPLTRAEHAQLRALPDYDGPGSSWMAQPPTLDRIRQSLETPDEKSGRGAVRISLRSDGIALNGLLAEGRERTPSDDWDAAIPIGMAASGALALLVLTITLSLRSVDGETDRRAAFAAGVAPAALRHQRAFEGVVLSLLGAALALPLGWIPVTAARLGVDGTDDISTFGEIVTLPGLAVIPILLAPAAGAALLWTVIPALAARIRTARHRDLADDLIPRW